MDPRTVLLVLFGVVIVVLLALLILLFVVRPGSTPAQETASPTPTAASAEGTAPSQTAEPTPSPAATPTPAPATATPAPAALEMPAAVQEPEPADNAAYPDLDVQPNMVWPEEKQAPFRVATNADNLNMRKGPGTDYDLVGKAPHDGVVTRIGKLDSNSEWVLILSDGTYGWVSAEYLEPLN